MNEAFGVRGGQALADLREHLDDLPPGPLVGLEPLTLSVPPGRYSIARKTWPW